MKIIGYDSALVLKGVKTLAAKKTGYTEKEFDFIKRVMEWHEKTKDCLHENRVVAERVLSNGTVAHYEQCTFCGWGRAVKKDGTIPDHKWSEDSQEIRNIMWRIHRILESPELHLAINDDWAKLYAKGRDFQKKHHDHLKSKKWYDIRKRVMTRANGICEGCLTSPAEEVHHKTYAHLGDEFCFELIALCRNCHSRYHGAE